MLQTLSLAYGKHLTATGHLDDAGISFARAGLWQPALEAFVAALSWQQAVCAAFSLGLDAARVAEIARSLAGTRFSTGVPVPSGVCVCVHMFMLSWLYEQCL